MTARQSSLKILNRCFSNRSWSTQTINSETLSLTDSDRALATKISLGVIQNYMLLDFIIDSYCMNKKLDLCVRNILRVGAYQILFLDKIPVSAAVNESVNLAKISGFSSASGLVNAVLRKISSNPCPIVEDLSIKYSHPKWLVDRLCTEYGYDFTEAFLKCNNSEPTTDYHIGINGNSYVQDNASYRAVKMLNPQSGMKVLDACSAPGGKSFTSAVLMNNSGSIVSCDIHEKKLNLVRDGAINLGIDIISTRKMDASVFCSEFENYFDMVIADVPCSGIGVIRKKPDIRFKTEDEIKTLPFIQNKILNNLIRYLKNDGKLLYSTCTVLKEENEFITHNYNVIEEKTFWPNVDGTDGFYAAVIRK